MKAAPFAALVALATIVPLASPARADDTVRACIAASTGGQTLRRQGRLLAARDEMIACARDACPPIVRSSCARWLAEVDAAVPSVVVRAESAAGEDAIGGTLSIDGHPRKLDGQPVRLDPGEHTVLVVDDHGARKEARVLLAEGERARLVTLRFSAGAETPSKPLATATPRTSPSPSPSAPDSIGGIGVVALGSATYFGVRRITI